MKLKIKYKHFFFALMTSTFMIAQKKEQKENCTVNKSEKAHNMETTQKNVLGKNLKLASIDPLTGFYRTGFCSTDQNDRGLHVVAAVMTNKFLNYSRSQGNDLITPNLPYGFPGLKEGNVWCLCVLRWKEAMTAGFAPPVILEATNSKALEHVSLENLKQYENK